MAFYRGKVFPALAAGLWLVFLLLDLTGMADSTWVKFAAICLCAATAWTGARSADGILVAAALTLTVCADVFLLLLNRDMTDQLIGVSVFIVVQMLYACRLYWLRGNVPSQRGLALRVNLAVLLLFINDPPFSLPLFYFVNLCANCVEAFALKEDKPLNRFAWSLLLFIGCDVCVGAWNLGFWGDIARIGMWFFYLPSQVLIVLSQCLEGDIQ